jgi:hypothetical protein
MMKRGESQRGDESVWLAIIVALIVVTALGFFLGGSDDLVAPDEDGKAGLRGTPSAHGSADKDRGNRAHS